jgi:hypothetical protein
MKRVHYDGAKRTMDWGIESKRVVVKYLNNLCFVRQRFMQKIMTHKDSNTIPITIKPEKWQF